MIFRLIRALLPTVFATVTLTAQQRSATEPQAATVLEKFTVTESAAHRAGEILPTSRPVDSVFGTAESVKELPRSVTVITPELMARFGLEDLGDLGRIGAGTQAANFFGMTGTPYLRGVKANTFFNGMLRAYQRNEMPVSFGSLEAFDLVKGPAPAHFGPGLEGGYANLIPKSPYFDRMRGSLTLTAGTHENYKAQLDYGGPVLIGKAPAAFRISLTGQEAGSYWNNVENNYRSLYAALKIRPREDLTIFTGAEYYDFRSNENPGWNRVTQALIDNGDYLIGEPQNITDAAWNGQARRDWIEYPGSFSGKAPNFRALILPSATAESRIAPTLLALMEDRRTTDGGYRYTDAYFAAGGKALTEKLNGANVLADPDDYADAQNLLWFFDLVSTRNADRKLTWKTIFEWIDTTKNSSYGYATSTEQLVFENKLFVEQANVGGTDTALTYGASFRYGYANTLQDFDAEPFNRRDLTRPAISANSKVAAGMDRGPDGRNFWSPTLGGSTESDLFQTAIFGVTRTRWTERLSTDLSLRAEAARYQADLPAEIDRATPAQRTAADRKGGKNHASGALSVTWRANSNTNLYTTFQRGTSFQPGQGGTINSRSNFAAANFQEVGAKMTPLGDRLFATVALYQWKNFRFNDRDNRAERLRGRGAEIELTWVISPRFSLIASGGQQRVFRRDPLGFRASYGDEARIAMESGSLDGGVAPTPALNPRLIYPGTPETQAKVDFAWKATTAWEFSVGAVWSHSYYHNFERTLILPSSVVWRGAIRWQHGPLALQLTVENIFSSDYFIGGDPQFAHNDLVTKGAPAQGKLSARWSF